MAVAKLCQNPIGVPAMPKFSFRIDTTYAPARQPRLRRFDHIVASSGTVGSANLSDPLSRALNHLWNISMTARAAPG